jgi:hypothetical protein
MSLDFNTLNLLIYIKIIILFNNSRRNVSLLCYRIDKQKRWNWINKLIN